MIRYLTHETKPEMVALDAPVFLKDNMAGNFFPDMLSYAQTVE
ncbi:MAG TPA: hypothetical protein VMT63_01585 [Bacteroidales bacterium]|nr:hypothetical protein [Bacteroidales bacterium]